ncbi:MAG: ABC transporter permease [Phycisphaerae bacterium]
MSAASPQHLDLADYPTPPTQLLTASRGWTAVNLREVARSHELLLSLAWRDIRARYKQTVLGIVWVIIQPLFAAGIFSFIFTLVADLKAPGGAPYFLFTLASLLAWNGFSSVLNRSSGAMVNNAILVSKVYFPRLVLPASTIFTVIVDFAVQAVLLVVMLLLFWRLPGATVLLLPVCLVLLWGLALGVGLIAAAVAVSYRDALYVLPVFIQFLMWGSAVLFPLERVPEQYVTYLYLNPIVSLVEAFRWSVLGTGSVHWGFFAYSAGCTVLSLVVGAFAFRRMERRFADVI